MINTSPGDAEAFRLISGPLDEKNRNEASLFFLARKLITRIQDKKAHKIVRLAEKVVAITLKDDPIIIISDEAPERILRCLPPRVTKKTTTALNCAVTNHQEEADRWYDKDYSIFSLNPGMVAESLGLDNNFNLTLNAGPFSTLQVSAFRMTFETGNLTTAPAAIKVRILYGAGFASLGGDSDVGNQEDELYLHPGLGGSVVLLRPLIRIKDLRILKFAGGRASDGNVQFQLTGVPIGVKTRVSLVQSSESGSMASQKALSDGRPGLANFYDNYLNNRASPFWFVI